MKEEMQEMTIVVRTAEQEGLHTALLECCLGNTQLAGARGTTKHAKVALKAMI